MTASPSALKANVAQATAVRAAAGAEHRGRAELSLKRGVVPLTPAVAAEQQKIADTFHGLKLIPKAIPHQRRLAGHDHHHRK